jgi:hypothetical protein
MGIGRNHLLVAFDDLHAVRRILFDLSFRVIGDTFTTL